GGFTVVENDETELIPTRLVTGWRVCIDYQKLNEATRKDHFPLPFMDQMLERLVGNEYYCFLDGFSGYFQIPIDPHDQEKTTFMCPYGTFAYRRMPFSLCNASGTFQRCMLAIFHDMIKKMMEVFMDDFSIFGNSFGNCLSRVDKMLQRCKDTNLCLNWEKSHFMVKEGIVLGHKISKNGIEVDKAKVDVIAKLPHPTTVKGVRSFLGHAGFYRRFIKDFSKISRLMSHLLKKNTLFIFSDECIQAFETLKKKLIEASILIAPDWDLPFELMCDASDYAIGNGYPKKKDKNRANNRQNPEHRRENGKSVKDNFSSQTKVNNYVKVKSSSKSYEALLPKGNTSGSAEASIQLKELMVLIPNLVTRVTRLEKELKETKQTLGNDVLKLVKKVKSLEIALKRKSKKVLVSALEGEELEDQGRIIQDIDVDPLVSLFRESMKEKSTDFVTPTKASREAQEEEISPTILEATKTLSKVASQSVIKAKSTDKGKRYRRRARSMAKNINTGLDVEDTINTGRVEINSGIEDVNTGSTKVDTGKTSISTSSIILSPKKVQREGKAQMVEEDIQATHKTKEQIRQEEAGLENAIRLQAQMDEEVAKQIHLDKMVAKRVQEEQELSEQQLKRKEDV
ncbi:reverse transcriptase domain-containing protein, partial [Tanacetum coccineum]